jgi:3-hydroxybutyryl-CoA dehydrogenase
MASVGVIGAGLMGSGIAQLAASHGCTVVLSDVSEEVVRKGVSGIAKALDRQVEKNKLSTAERDQIIGRIQIATSPADFRSSDLVIEAVAEKLDIKLGALGAVKRHVGPQTVFASNTSSLSISQIGEGLGEARRVVGMHFFNPAPIMPLVEIIQGKQSDPSNVERVAEIARGWGKTVVHAKDTPGFVVNRVARGYYLESLRMLGEGIAGVEEIDRIMRDLGGFRMGPFELMDLVGIDVNYSVSESVWQQLGKPARLMPNPIQADLYQKGELGRKSKRGFYAYDSEPPAAIVKLPHKELSLAPEVAEAVQRFSVAAAAKPGTTLQSYVFARPLIAILNEAAFTFDDGVATKADIDTAMRLGTNYPRGPWAWIDKIGVANSRRLLQALNSSVGDGRFAPAKSLSEQSSS